MNNNNQSEQQSSIKDRLRELQEESYNARVENRVTLIELSKINLK
jgi:hypothetical protein